MRCCSLPEQSDVFRRRHPAHADVYDGCWVRTSRAARLQADAATRQGTARRAGRSGADGIAGMACCRERLNLPAFGGFEDWSCRVREALIWLDRTDPCETSVDVRDSDPHRGELVTVVEQWKEHLVLNLRLHRAAGDRSRPDKCRLPQRADGGRIISLRRECELRQARTVAELR